MTTSTDDSILTAAEHIGIAIDSVGTAIRDLRFPSPDNALAMENTITMLANIAVAIDRLAAAYEDRTKFLAQEARTAAANRYPPDIIPEDNQPNVIPIQRERHPDEPKP